MTTFVLNDAVLILGWRLFDAFGKVREVVKFSFLSLGFYWHWNIASGCMSNWFFLWYFYLIWLFHVQSCYCIRTIEGVLFKKVVWCTVRWLLQVSHSWITTICHCALDCTVSIIASFWDQMCTRNFCVTKWCLYNSCSWNVIEGIAWGWNQCIPNILYMWISL